MRVFGAVYQEVLYCFALVTASRTPRVVYFLESMEVTVERDIHGPQLKYEACHASGDSVRLG